VKYRKLGEIMVSEIGFGTWGIGGLTEGASSYGPTDDSVSKLAIRTALGRGINFFETSELYGNGHSEELLGEVMRQDNCRDSAVIATKGGLTKYHGDRDLSIKGLRNSLTGSLRRLKTNYVDLYQLHDPPIEMIDKEVIDTLQELRKEGLIKEFGLSLKSPKDGARAIALGFKILQINFNLVDQRAWDCGLLDEAKRREVKLIARTPFCFGFLTGKITSLNFHARDHRSSWPKAQLEKWLEAAEMFDRINENKDRGLNVLALKFCLISEVFSSVIPGIQTPDEALENAAASQWPDLTPEEIKAIRNIYQKNNFHITAT